MCAMRTGWFTAVTSAMTSGGFGMHFPARSPSFRATATGSRISRGRITHGNRYVDGGLPRFSYRAREEACDVVLFGHTHMPLVTEDGGILYVNPGSAAMPRQADRRRTYAVITVSDGRATARIEDLELHAAL